MKIIEFKHKVFFDIRLVSTLDRKWYSNLINLINLINFDFIINYIYKLNFF